MLNLWQLFIIAIFGLIRLVPTIVVSKYGRSNMANIGRFWSSLHFELHFRRMIQHNQNSAYAATEKRRYRVYFQSSLDD